ncbi:hypothetical protein HDV02_000168 [Globomyces sp. JEL0801]|nr:hypothetical protein HDV02_000168 [Globomyces sp. JEL0801]
MQFPENVRVILFQGPSGSGKTTMAGLLLEKLRVDYPEQQSVLFSANKSDLSKRDEKTLLDIISKYDEKGGFLILDMQLKSNGLFGLSRTVDWLCIELYADREELQTRQNSKSTQRKQPHKRTSYQTIFRPTYHFVSRLVTANDSIHNVFDNISKLVALFLNINDTTISNVKFQSKYNVDFQRLVDNRVQPIRYASHDLNPSLCFTILKNYKVTLIADDPVFSYLFLSDTYVSFIYKDRVFSVPKQFLVPRSISNRSNIVLSGYFTVNEHGLNFTALDMIFLDGRDIWCLNHSARQNLLSAFQIPSKYQNTPVGFFCISRPEFHDPESFVPSDTCTSLYFANRGPGLLYDYLNCWYPKKGMEIITNIKKRSKEIQHISKEFRHRDSHIARMMSFDEIVAASTNLLSKGFIKQRIHPESGILIFNYTNISASEADMFRGLMLDISLKTVEDLSSTENDTSIVKGTTKMDGSMIVVVKWNGFLLVATRGRFDTDQAIWAKKWILENKLDRFLKDHFTYSFELVGGDNLHIVNYEVEGLIMLAVCDALGNELEYSQMVELAAEMGVCPCNMIIGPLKYFKDQVYSDNYSEGWVILNDQFKRTKLISSNWERQWKSTKFISPDYCYQKIRKALIGQNYYEFIKEQDWPQQRRQMLDEINEAFNNHISSRLSDIKASLEHKRSAPELQKFVSKIQELQMSVTQNSGCFNFNPFDISSKGSSGIDAFVCTDPCQFCLVVLFSSKPRQSTIPGYIPSKRIQQTIKKSWLTKSVGGIHQSVFPGEIYDIIISYMSSSSCAKLYTVCSYWKSTIDYQLKLLDLDLNAYHINVEFLELQRYGNVRETEFRFLRDSSDSSGDWWSEGSDGSY